MGLQDATDAVDHEGRRNFTRALLADVAALERMIDSGMIEHGVRRIGAEQEMFLIDKSGRPAGKAVEVLAALDNPSFTTELARFNLEANLPPYQFGGDCLKRMRGDLDRLTGLARVAAESRNCDVLLTGILPTLQMSDLGLDNMTPVPRYRALNDAMVQARGGDFTVGIKGIDELYVEHDNVMLESCNTSFQVHFQVGPAEFAKLYNLAQAVSGPVLAAAVNSPLLLGKRLWHETRIALFRHSVDDRNAALQARGRKARVRFGDKWIDDSVLEIFREDIARFRVVLAPEFGEDPLERVARGEAPALSALRLHNGTVYRWNRACYGVHEGKAHLRIENRILPAGPTVLDEVANAAFFFGLMAGIADRHTDIREVISFDDVRANFIAAARHGLRAQFTWIGGRTSTAQALIRNELLPMARDGLLSHGLDAADVDEYLGVIHDRVEAGTTGAQWMLDSFARMDRNSLPIERSRALTRAIHARQWTGGPVHTWTPAEAAEAKDWRHGYQRIEQFMTTDLFTVQPDDLLDLAANVMDWKHIRHVPVEDGEGRLVGVLSNRTLVRVLAQRAGGGVGSVAVRDVMKKNPVTVEKHTTTLEAIGVMRKHKVGCLPVVDDGMLVGIVTEHDLLNIAARLFEDQLREFGTA